MVWVDVHWCGRCAIVGILGRVLPFRGMADYRLAHQFHSLLNPNFVLVVRMYLSDVRWIGESVVVALVVVSYLGTWQ